MAPPCGPPPGFADLFAALPVAMLTIGPDGCIAHANAACEQLLNQSVRSMRGQPLGDLLPDQPRRGDDFAAFDAEIVTARGVRLRADIAEADVGDHPGWRVMTIHPAAALRFDRGAGGRAATGAAAMLAHEIKNPLSGIRGAAQLLGPGELTQLITTEVDRVAALIDRMQDFTDTRPLPVQAENIYPLLAHARDLALAGFARGVPIEERFDPSLPLACVNRDALLQVLINLLKNAREAVADERDPVITVATAYRHGMARAGSDGRRVALPIEIAVIDNGPGAPPDLAEHLFDPFVSGRPEGQGLGLALVDKLVRDMGGVVQYAREGSPEMTVFRLLLPRAA
jgi:two-component system, NtrC family, nitrogen regulation sensor histidine kinase GlnL